MMRKLALPSVLVGLAVTFTQSVALAQPGAPGSGPGPSTAAPSAEPPTAAARAEAEERFKKGIQFYNGGDYKLALIEFDRAYQLAPNYRVLFNIGQVNMQLNNYAAALRALEKYMQDGGNEIPDARRAQVKSDIALLRDRTANVTFTTNVPAEIFVDDVSYGTTPMSGPVLLDAGQHIVRATAEGREATTRVVTLAGAEKTAVAIELKEKKPLIVVTEAPKRSDAPLVVSLVATGAFTTAAIVTGVLSLNAQNQLSDLREGSFVVTQGELDSTASRAQTYAVVADITGGLAIVSAGFALYFLLRPAPKAEAPQTASVTVAPRLGGGGLAVRF